MSSRALRRLQKEQEEAKALQAAQAAEAESSEDETPAPVKSKPSAFAFLPEDGQSDNDDDEHEIDEPEDTPNRNVASSTPSKPLETSTGTSTPKSAKKKKKKKSKATKSTTTTNGDNDDEDDIDAVLAQLASEKQDQPKLQNDDTSSFYKLLAVDSQHLHAINEMRRLFGRDALDDRPQQQNPRAQRGRRGVPQQEQGRGFPAISLKRNIFVQGKETWPRAATGGLGMEVVSTDTDGTTHYRFVHSTSYQETQRQYEIAVASMDPNRLVVLLQQNPYHIATLLQISEIMKQDRTYTEAGDVLERALFAFGRTVHSTFGKRMEEGKARLSFDYPENREFYLAAWRYVLDLSMRSTWRTVYEWAKLLLSLSPEDDPYAIWFVLDQFALRANQAEDYMKLFQQGDFWRKIGTLDPTEMFGFSMALCALRTSDINHGYEAPSLLRENMMKYPYTAHTLCKLLDIEPMPPVLWKHHEAPCPRLALISAMYTTRAKDLWNTPEAKKLLVEVAKSIKDTEGVEIPLGGIPSDGGNYVREENSIPVSLARQVYLSENDGFLRLMANCNIDGTSSDVGPRPTQDPFPPDSEIRSYDARPEGLSRGGGWGGLGGGTGGLPPGLEALMGRIQPDQREALMEELARMQMGGPGGAGEGEAPGAWGSEDDEEFDRED